MWSARDHGKEKESPVVYQLHGKTGRSTIYLNGMLKSQTENSGKAKTAPNFLHLTSDKGLRLVEPNLRSGVLFSEERERKATRDSAVSQALVRREKRPASLALRMLYFRVPPKKERLIAG